MTKSSKKSGAAALIAAAKSKQLGAPDLTPAQLAELQAVLDFNDSVPRARRVTAEATAEMLGALGWPCKDHTTLAKICRRQLGRRSFSTR